jgi:acetolactate synthase-1/2/3 large subunit
MSDTKSGAELIVQGLIDAGTEVVFGFPGGRVIPLYNVLYDAPIRHILTRHEQGAAHAADGYARTTGKVGVCVATSGPGATNLVTGLANAHMDSVPMVAITGQVSVNMIGNDSFQEADTYGISLPVTKYNYLVRDASMLPYVIKEAFYIASTGRPGPVLIDIPSDLQVEKVEASQDRPGQAAGVHSGHQRASQADRGHFAGHQDGPAAGDLRGRRGYGVPCQRRAAQVH